MESIKKLFVSLNQNGIAIPTITDPRTGKGSVTLTMMIISFNTALLGQLGKFADLLGDVDMSAAMYLFVTTSALYLGRKFQSDGKTTTLDKEEGK